MKNLKRIIGVFFIMLIATGCTMKNEYAIKINSDKSLTVSTLVLMDDELLEGLLSMQEESANEDVNYTEDEKWAYIETMMEENELTDEDTVIEKHEKDGFKGYIVKKEFASIDEVTGDNASFDLNNDSISDTVIFSKNGDNYKANIIFEETDDMSSGASAGVLFEISFVVTLPNKPVSHNATSVSEDGKTLTWDLMDENFDGIDFEFNFESISNNTESSANDTESGSGSNNTMLFIIAGVALLAVVIIIVFIIMNKNKKNKALTNE